MVYGRYIHKQLALNFYGWPRLNGAILVLQPQEDFASHLLPQFKLNLERFQKKQKPMKFC